MQLCRRPEGTSVPGRLTTWTVGTLSVSFLGISLHRQDCPIENVTRAPAQQTQVRHHGGTVSPRNLARPPKLRSEPAPSPPLELPKEEPHGKASFQRRPGGTGSTALLETRNAAGMCQTSHQRVTNKQCWFPTWFVVVGASEHLRKNPRVRGAPARAGRSRLHCISAAVAAGRQMCSRQHQQSGEKRPEHQAHRQGKRAIDFLKIQPRQRQDISVLQGF